MDNNDNNDETQTKALEDAAEAVQNVQLPAPVPRQPRRGGSALTLFTDEATHKRAWAVAKMYADSALVPDKLRGNTGDCLIALVMADQLGENPIMLMQSIYFVSGKAGWDAKYMIAKANGSGIFRGTIKWREEVDGKVGQYDDEKQIHPSHAERDNIKVTAYATLAETGEEVSFPVSLRDAYREGWASKPGNKYKTLPQLMLRYRSATFLIRLYAPHVMLGLHTVDELYDMDPGYAGPAKKATSNGHDALRQAVGLHAEDDGIIDGECEEAPAETDNPFPGA